MNTRVIFREATGACGRESHLPTVRFHAGCRWVTTGLWFALALLASGMVFSSAATAQDASWQDPPRRQARVVAPSYPDEELPSRRVAQNDDTPPLTPADPAWTLLPRRRTSPPRRKRPSRRVKRFPMTSLSPLGECLLRRGAPWSSTKAIRWRRASRSAVRGEDGDEQRFRLLRSRHARIFVAIDCGSAARRCCGGFAAGRRRRC